MAAIKTTVATASASGIANLEREPGVATPIAGDEIDTDDALRSANARSLAD